MRKHAHSQQLPLGTTDAGRTVLSSPQAAIAAPRQATTYPTDTLTVAEVIRWVHSYPNERILRLPQVVTISGRSRPAVWLDVANGTFPRPLPLGARARGWRESEVMGWIEATTILSRVANPGFSMKEFVEKLMASRIPIR